MSLTSSPPFQQRPPIKICGLSTQHIRPIDRTHMFGRAAAALQKSHLAKKLLFQNGPSLAITVVTTFSEVRAGDGDPESCKGAYAAGFGCFGLWLLVCQQPAGFMMANSHKPCVYPILTAPSAYVCTRAMNPSMQGSAPKPDGGRLREWEHCQIEGSTWTSVHTCQMFAMLVLSHDNWNLDRGMHITTLCFAILCENLTSDFTGCFCQMFLGCSCALFTDPGWSFDAVDRK